MTKEKKKEDKVELLLDDIKKKVGASRIYIDEQIAILDTKLEGFERGIFDGFESLKETLDLCMMATENNQNKSSQALNRIMDIEKEVPSFDNLEVVIRDNEEIFNAKLDNQAISIIRIEEEFSEKINQCVSLSALLKKEIERNTDCLVMESKTLKTTLGVCEELKKDLSDFRKLSDHKKILDRETGEDIVVLKKGISDSKASLSDLNRSLTSTKSLLVENISEVRDSISKKPDHLYIDELDKKLSSMVDEIKKMSESPKSTLSAQWKDQMEMKMARLEKKVNGD